jgi:hypothetical protein
MPRRRPPQSRAPRVAHADEAAPLVNLKCLGMLLVNSYGKRAIALTREDPPLFTVARARLPDAVKKQWDGEIVELSVGLDQDDNLFACAVADVTFTDAERDRVTPVLAQAARDMGLCYGSFGSLDDEHVTFVIGIPGSGEAVVSAVIVADTIAYALNAATVAIEHMQRAGFRARPPRPLKPQRRAARRRPARRTSGT